MGESRLTERRAFRRRSLVAFGVSLTLHGTLFALLAFLIPTGRLDSSVSLAVSLQEGGSAGPGVALAGAASRLAAGDSPRPVPAPRPAADRDALADAAETARFPGGEGRSESATRPEYSLAGEAAVDSSGNGSASPGGPAESGAAGNGGSAPGPTGGAIGGVAAGEKDADPAADLAARVLAAVEARKAYPEAARRRGTEGRVRLKFSVAEDGRLLSAKLAASSGSALLDSAALELLASVFPVENDARRELDGLAISIDYGLKR